MGSRFHALLAGATALLVVGSCAGPDSPGSDLPRASDRFDWKEISSEDWFSPETVADDVQETFSAEESVEVVVDVDVPPIDQDGDGLTDSEELQLGTNPQLSDTDYDSFGDGEEVTSGTDPLDPSSAAAWHREWDEFPWLVFGPEALAELKAKAADPGPRGAAMLARVKARADAIAAPPEVAAYDPYHEVSRARIASSAAFVGLLFDDESYAQKAVDIALGLNPNIDEVGFSSPFFTKTSIHAGEAVAYYAKMFDWLRASELLSEETLAAVQVAVVELVTRFEKEATSGPMAALLALAQNNHNVKAYGAIGLAGIVFPDEPLAARWVHRGVTEVRYYFLDFQTTSDGGYAEGPNYLNYCLGEGLSLLWAYHRFTDGKESYVRHFYDTREAQEEIVEWIPDPLSEPLLEQLFLWPLKIMLPGGLAPNIDDASLSAVSGGYLAALFDSPVFLWHWELPAVGRTSGSGIDLAADIFALLDEEMVATPPEFSPDMLLEGAGNCVLREGFGDDDDYALMLGEHGKIRKHGQGHEHPDASQLLIHARGEYLLMDSGYISWEEKDVVSHPENHNLILVDGEGPPDSEYTGIGSDTYLSGFHVDESGYKGCRSETAYAGATFRRDLLVTPHDVVVVLDRVEAASDANLTIVWHGNGGGSSGGEFFPGLRGGAWVRNGASLVVTVANRAAAADCDSVTQVHALSHGAPLEHSALHCTTVAQEETFLSVFQIGDGDSEVPDFAEEVIVPGGGGLALRSYTDSGMSIVIVWLPVEATPGHIILPECGPIDVISGLSVVVVESGCNVLGNTVIPNV